MSDTPELREGEHVCPFCGWRCSCEDGQHCDGWGSWDDDGWGSWDDDDDDDEEEEAPC